MLHFLFCIIKLQILQNKSTANENRNCSSRLTRQRGSEIEWWTWRCTQETSLHDTATPFSTSLLTQCNTWALPSACCQHRPKQSWAIHYHTPHHTTTVFRPSFRDHPGEPVPEENFWTLWCKGRLTEADTPTIRLGVTPAGLNSAHLHHPAIFYRPDALPAAKPTVSKDWRQLAHSD